MNKSFCAILIQLVLLSNSIAFATQRHVPLQYATIQSAINAALHTDTVLVAPGRYFENIVFRGKRITVASHFLTTGNRSFIRTTIIDGSQPQSPDTASVVRIVNGEDSTTVLAGFTITGGKGTKWPDVHINQVFREGGGILCEGSSPVIRDNFIYRNDAVGTAGVASAGGGGIRADGGNPRILHNVIQRNRGRYGAGIVLNYCGGIIRNNIISLNSGGQSFGGSGIWILEDGPAPKLIENNTITGNTSSNNGGGLLVQTTTVTLRNNIIYGNTGAANPQIFTQAGGVIIGSFNLVEGGTPAMGSVSGAYPLFTDSSGTLLPGSTAIDAGDPAALNNDPADPMAPALALAPATGTIRNDIGAYGGAGSAWFTQFSEASLALVANIAITNASHGNQVQVKIPFVNRGLTQLGIDSIRLQTHGSQFQLQSNFPMVTRPVMADTLRLLWTPTTGGQFTDTLLVYHTDTATLNPRKVRLVASVLSGAEVQETEGYCLLGCSPNPATVHTQISYELAQPSLVRITLLDALGRTIYSQAAATEPAGARQQLIPVYNLPDGLYYCRLQVNPFQPGAQPVVFTTKLVIVQ